MNYAKRDIMAMLNVFMVLLNISLKFSLSDEITSFRFFLELMKDFF